MTNPLLGDKMAKALGAAAQVSLDGDGLTLRQKGGE